MSINRKSKQYREYVRIQCEAEDRHKDHPKNNQADGHKNDTGNRILVNMVSEQGIRGHVLDIGCNFGYHTEELANLCGSAVGIDVNKRLIQLARRFNRYYCQEGDMHNLAFDDESFDLVFAHEVLEHAADFGVVLDECKRVLRPGGYVVFSMPCEGHWKDVHITEDCLHVYFEKGGQTEACDSHFYKPTVDDVYIQLARRYEIVKLDVRNLTNLAVCWPYKRGQHWPFRPHLFGVVKKV